MMSGLTVSFIRLICNPFLRWFSCWVMRRKNTFSLPCDKQKFVDVNARFRHAISLLVTLPRELLRDLTFVFISFTIISIFFFFYLELFYSNLLKINCSYSFLFSLNFTQHKAREPLKVGSYSWHGNDEGVICRCKRI